jgi:hypothetical protein
MSARLAAGLMLAAAMALSACGDKAATSKSGRKPDTSPVAGADPAYKSQGWTVGDATSWDQHMRARTQQQNEYARMETAPR